MRFWYQKKFQTTCPQMFIYPPCLYLVSLSNKSCFLFWSRFQVHYGTTNHIALFWSQVLNADWLPVRGCKI
jgi:hypothetical protein